MMFIDTHTHLFLPHFDGDRDVVVKEAIAQGVEKMIIPNIDTNTIKQVLDLSEKYPGHCYPAMGIHPNSIQALYQDEVKTIEKELASEKYCAVGETGFDLYWDKTYINQQTEVFKLHIEWSIKYGLPLIIHSREAVEPILKILKAYSSSNVSGVFHSFTGTIGQAKEIIDNGFKIGVGGIVTFKNAGIDQLIAQLSLNDIILETDSPYLAPVPKRGKRNESAYLIYIAEKIAEIFDVSTEEVAGITTGNANNLFNLL